MAVKTQLVDDIDNTVIESGKGGTIAFSLKGRQYEIDLNDDNQERLEKALEPFVKVARQAGHTTSSSRSSSRRRSTSGGRRDLPAVRSWATANGYQVSPRGRIRQEILDAYDAAH